MPQFTYTARDSHGAATSGTITADSIAAASQQLRADGKYPTAVNPAVDEEAPSSAGGQPGLKIARADVIQISTQLAIMVETGVTLSEALDCIAQQCEKPNVKLLVDDIARHVQGGGDFSTALSRHPRSFPRLYIALIKASEKSGLLGKLIVRATTYLKDEQDTIRRVKGAMTYPAIMLTFAVSVTVFLLAFVLPRFASIYAGKGAALPLPTKILMSMSDFVVNQWMWLITGVVGVVFCGMLFFRTEFGRRVRDYLQLNVPLMGSMFRKMHLARSLRMVGTMAGAGINLVECVNTAHDLCDNSYYRELWQQVSEKIQTGKQLSEPMFQSPLVPRGVSQMLHSAEKSGKLAHVMEQVAGFAEQELKDKIAELTRYIEPIMIIAMGIIIGGVAMALLLPIFTMSRVVAS